MKKIIFAVMAVSLTVVSCKSSSSSVNNTNKMENVKRQPVGMWKAMEWSSDAKIVQDNSILKVMLPKGENSVVLECSNYSRFWLSSVDAKNLGRSEKNVCKGEGFEVRCEGNKLTVTLSQEKTNLNVVVQSGDIFSNINFVR